MGQVALRPPFMNTAKTDLSAAIGALSRALSSTGARHMIIGGIAMIARGVPRHTDDVDATIAAEALDLNHLAETLATEDIVPRIDDAVDFARKHQVLLLRHTPSGTDIDVSLAWLPFEMEALGRAELLDLGKVRALVAQPEDLVVYKAVAFRERDRADIERLLELYGDKMDLDRIDDIVTQFANALDEPERATAFLDLKRRVLQR